MIIKSITITNFQAYFNEQTLEFSNGLNLIIGNGGKGKSTLLNAFYWVLFGKIYARDLGWFTTNSLPQSASFKVERHDFFNKRALYLTPVGESVTAKVLINIEDDKGNSYLIERSASALRLDCTEWDSKQAWDVKSNMLKISFDTPTGTKYINDILAEDKISELFPISIRNYIWFQGETLVDLINFKNRETLKNAVKHISYFPFYEKLTEIICKSKVKIANQENKKLKDLNRHNSEVKSLITSIESLNYKISKEEENISEIESNISKIEIALAEGESKISGLAKFTDLVSRYGKCENEITRLQSDISRLDEYQRRMLPSLWILRGIEPLVRQCKNIIEKHRDEELTMPERKYLDEPGRSKLEEILRTKKCFVCGTSFTENDAPYLYIQERLKLQEKFLIEMEEYANNLQFSKQFNMFVGKIQDYPDTLLLSLSTIDEDWKKSESQLSLLIAQRNRKNNEKSKLDEQIQDIKAKHGVDPIAQANNANIIDSNIRVSRSNLERQKRLLDTAKASRDSYKKELKAKEKELESLGANNAIVASVAETEWKHISTFLEDICKRVQERARKELLKKIEERANIFYDKFTEHDNGYKDTVKIKEDYTIVFDPLLNSSHEVRIKMSIINALLSLNQEAMNVYYPFITDAPTSDFDAETAFHYLVGIKDIFHQSIVITKDVEVDSERYNRLRIQNNINRIFHLDSIIHSGDSNRGKHEVSTKVSILK